jgi:hypothetical protein
MLIEGYIQIRFPVLSADLGPFYHVLVFTAYDNPYLLRLTRLRCLHVLSY